MSEMLSTCSNGRLRILRERRLKYGWQLRASFMIKGGGVGGRGATRFYDLSRRPGRCAAQPCRRSATDAIILNRELDLRPSSFLSLLLQTRSLSKVHEVLVHSFGAAKSQTP